MAYCLPDFGMKLDEYGNRPTETVSYSKALYGVGIGSGCPSSQRRSSYWNFSLISYGSGWREWYLCGVELVACMGDCTYDEEQWDDNHVYNKRFNDFNDDTAVVLSPRILNFYFMSVTEVVCSRACVPENLVIVSPHDRERTCFVPLAHHCRSLSTSGWSRTLSSGFYLVCAFVLLVRLGVNLTFKEFLWRLRNKMHRDEA